MATVLRAAEPSSHQQPASAQSGYPAGLGARRMSRPPPARQPAIATTADDNDANGLGDVVPVLRSRLEAESAYLSQRLSSQQQQQPYVPPLSPTDTGTSSSLGPTVIDFPMTASKHLHSNSPATAAATTAAVRSPSKIPVSPLTRARSSKPPPSSPSSGGPTGSPSTTRKNASSRALQAATAAPSSSSQLMNDSGSSDDSPSGSIRPPHAGSGLPIRSSSRTGTISPPPVRLRTKSTPFAVASTSSVRATSPPFQGVGPVGSSVDKTGLMPLYLAPSDGEMDELPRAQEGQTKCRQSIGDDVSGQPYEDALADGHGRTIRQQQQQQPLAPPLQPTWSGASHLSTDDTQLHSSSHSHPTSSYTRTDRAPSTLHPLMSQRRPSDRLIRDEPAPFQILSRDLPSLRPDGRVELGSGDGFTERELVRQMPDVWRRESLPAIDRSTQAADVDGGSPAVEQTEASPQRRMSARKPVAHSPTPDSPTRLSSNNMFDHPAVPGSPTWSADAERALVLARAEDERKRLERRRELLDIARHGWELDDHLTPREEFPPAMLLGAAVTPAMPTAKRLSASATTGSLATIAAVSAATTTPAAGRSERSSPPLELPHHTSSVSSLSVNPASSHTPAATASAVTVDEQEARRRRREEGAQRQRALSTGGALGANSGRRSVSSPSSGTPGGSVSPSSQPAPMAVTASSERSDLYPAAAQPAPTSTSSAAVASVPGSSSRRSSGGGRPSVGTLDGGSRRPSVTSPTAGLGGIGGTRPGGGPSSSVSGSNSHSGGRRTSLQAATSASAGPSTNHSSRHTTTTSAPSADDNEEPINETSSVRLSLYGEDAVPPMAADKPTRDELMNWDSVVLPTVRKNKKHNPLLEWDDSISNPSSTPPSKLATGRSREPYTPPSRVGGAEQRDETLHLDRDDRGVIGEEEDEEDWPPPAPGTFGYKPPRSRTTTAVSATTPSVPSEPARQPLEEKPDPANATFGGQDAVEERWDPLARPAATTTTAVADDGRSHDMHSPAPSSSAFDGSVNGHRRMSKVRDSASYHPQVSNPVVEAEEHDAKLAATAEEKRRASRRRRERLAEEEENEGVVRKSGCCGGGCVVM